MKITCHFQPDSPEIDLWVRELAQLLPDSVVTHWKPGEPPADYAVVWCPTREFVAQQPHLKAMFNAGAGVDSFLKLGLEIPCPLIRLEDAGMADQMCEYVLHAVLDHMRDFERYRTQQQAAAWAPLAPRDKADYPVGILGLGVLGQRVAQALLANRFQVHAWSRSQQHRSDGIQRFHGQSEFKRFLAASQVLVCLLPLTPETNGILNRQSLRQLRRGAYIINVARGGHVVDEDLIAAIDDGHIVGATLDVFREEPLPPEHPFWRHPSIRVTPHISAATLRSDSIQQIAIKIQCLEAGRSVSGIVDMQRGY